MKSSLISTISIHTVLWLCNYWNGKRHEIIKWCIIYITLF